MLKKSILVFSLPLLLLMLSCTRHVETNAMYDTATGMRTVQADSLIAQMQQIARGGAVAFGHQDDTVYGFRRPPGQSTEQVCSDIKDVCGALPMVVGFDLL